MVGTYSVIVTAIVLGYSVFVLDTQPHFSLFIGAVVAGLCAYYYGVSWTLTAPWFHGTVVVSLSL